MKIQFLTYSVQQFKKDGGKVDQKNSFRLQTALLKCIKLK